MCHHANRLITFIFLSLTAGLTIAEEDRYKLNWEDPINIREASLRAKNPLLCMTEDKAYIGQARYDDENEEAVCLYPRKPDQLKSGWLKAEGDFQILDANYRDIDRWLNQKKFYKEKGGYYSLTLKELSDLPSDSEKENTATTCIIATGAYYAFGYIKEEKCILSTKVRYVEDRQRLERLAFNFLETALKLASKDLPDYHPT